MSRFTHRSLFGTVGLVVLFGCQGAPPQEEASQDPKEEEAVVEETFESGDTGTLTSGSEESTESEAQPEDDSQ